MRLQSTAGSKNSPQSFEWQECALDRPESSYGAPLLVEASPDPLCSSFWRSFPMPAEMQRKIAIISLINIHEMQNIHIYISVLQNFAFIYIYIYLIMMTMNIKQKYAWEIVCPLLWSEHWVLYHALSSQSAFPQVLAAHMYTYIYIWKSVWVSLV